MSTMYYSYYSVQMDILCPRSIKPIPPPVIARISLSGTYRVHRAWSLVTNHRRALKEGGRTLAATMIFADILFIISLPSFSKSTACRDYHIYITSTSTNILSESASKIYTLDLNSVIFKVQRRRAIRP
jgi:hypothetical protein